MTTALQEINKPHYPYWKAWLLAFYSQALYIDVGRRWKGLALGYLVLIICLFSLPFSVRVMDDINHFFDKEVLVPFQKLPSFYLQNGKVLFNKPMPYFVRNDSNEVIAIIDTTGIITKPKNDEYPNLSILITQNELFYRFPSPQFFFTSEIKQPTASFESHAFDKRMNQYFDGQQWINQSGIMRIKWILIAIIYPSIAFLFFVIYLLCLLVFAMLAQLVASTIFKYSLNYGPTFRLLTVAATPQMALLGVLMTFNSMFSGSGFFLIGLLAMYFSFAVLALKRDSSQLVHY